MLNRLSLIVLFLALAVPVAAGPPELPSVEILKPHDNAVVPSETFFKLKLALDQAREGRCFLSLSDTFFYAALGDCSMSFYPVAGSGPDGTRLEIHHDECWGAGTIEWEILRPGDLDLASSRVLVMTAAVVGLWSGPEYLLYAKCEGVDWNTTQEQVIFVVE